MSLKGVQFHIRQLTEKARDGVHLIFQDTLINPFILKLNGAGLQQSHFSETCSFAPVSHPVLKEFVHISKKLPHIPQLYISQKK